MKVYVIYCRMDEVEDLVNDFLRDVPVLDIDHIDVAGFQPLGESPIHWVAVFIWLKVSQGGARE